MNRYIKYIEYINTLIRNENNTSSPCLQDLYTFKDYHILLKPVLDIIRNNPHASLTTLRMKLFLKSGLKEAIDLFVHDTSITSGILLDFGTPKTRDTVLCGLRQEVVFDGGNLRRCELPIEQDTIFDLASTSKLFTAVATLILEEKGLIDVFDEVKKCAPEFTDLDNITIYDLLKFRINIKTKRRVDSAKNKEEALNILYTAYPYYGLINNAYTDMGAMILRIIIEKITHMPLDMFLKIEVFDKLKMEDTYLNVPKNKLYRVANENYSTIINEDGRQVTRFDNYPGTVHDPKAVAIGHQEGITPGHAGFFSTKNDMIKFANALITEQIISKESLMSISNTETGFKEDDNYTWFYGSLVYLKQPYSKKLQVYPPLSGRAFMSPGFAGTHLVIDPLNEITLFMASPRLHNRIYMIHPKMCNNIKVNDSNKKTYFIDGQEKIVGSDYTKAKEVLVELALDLSIQYQLLEKLCKEEKEMHLVREL